jgi:hypothetical protein
MVQIVSLGRILARQSAHNSPGGDIVNVVHSKLHRGLEKRFLVPVGHSQPQVGVSARQPVDDAAQRVEVHGELSGCVLLLLRCAVVNGAMRYWFTHHTSRVKVDQLEKRHPIRWCKVHDVLWLEVAVHHIYTLQRIQCGNDGLLNINIGSLCYFCNDFDYIGRGN